MQKVLPPSGVLVLSITIAFWAIIYTRSFAQITQAGQDIEWILEKGKVRHLPFYTVHNLMIIPISINGSDTLRFILDTGVRSTIISELAYNDSLSLRATGRVKVRGYGTGDPLEALVSINNLLRIAGVEFDSQRVLVLMQDVFHLSTRMGLRVHGIIGYDVFKHFVVEVNYESRLLSFYPPKKFYAHYTKRGKKAYLPVAIENEKPYIQAHVRLNQDSLVPLKLLIDTGGSHSLWLFGGVNSGFTVPRHSLPVYLGRGLNGDVRGHLARLPALHLGEYIFEDMLVSYPELAATKDFQLMSDRNGSIGSDILRRFHFALDYSHGRLYLTPNKFYEAAFEHNMSGMEVYSPYPSLPIFVVAEVKPNSPAEAAGLMPEDQIVSINHNHTQSMTLDEINGFFCLRNGKKLKVRVLRGSKEVVCKLVLKRQI